MIEEQIPMVQTIVGLRKEVDALQTERTVREQRIRRLREQRDLMKAELDRLRARLNPSVEWERDRLLEELAMLRECNRGLSECKRGLSEGILVLRGKVAAAEKKASDLEETNKLLIAACDTQKNIRRNDVDHLTARLTAAYEERNKAERSVRSLSEENEKLRKQPAVVLATGNDYVTHAALLKERDDLRAERIYLEDRVKFLVNRNTRMQDLIRAASKSAEKIETAGRQLSSDLDSI